MAENKSAKGDVAGLFKKAMALDDKVEAAKVNLQKIIDERSDAVKAVYEANGNDAGPFQYKGELMTIRHRAPKDDEGKLKEGASETWFFVSIGGSALQNIE